MSDRLPLLKITVESDGGPWARHNMPCGVCQKNHAVLDLNLWVYLPCWYCQDEGWEMRRCKPRWWQKRYRRRSGVSP